MDEDNAYRPPESQPRLDSKRPNWLKRLMVLNAILLATLTMLTTLLMMILVSFNTEPVGFATDTESDVLLICGLLFGIPNLILGAMWWFSRTPST
jgi:hypothetical protein